ncbi:YchJ family metal-binding protein [Photobacterium sp.]|uniref:YchJ family metal-binding protein n=1 Tax=Photobacterium sp. TaxID=660 RepID=UPI00299F4247|nr:YchJ family metal-binding protein [Photobacterium sp.]MDX1303132.1 YchJ family metal-binding protein [Photobacterium sp.]
MSKPQQACPCGSQKSLAKCCQPIHLSAIHAEHPEQLMRARYSAHVLGIVDFVIATYHPSCQAEQYREAIAESVSSQWLGLDIISSEITDNDEGFVEFKAYYQEGKEQHCLHERSRFLREPVNGEQQWFYIDGDYPESPPQESPLSQESTAPAISPAVSNKISRNDPCPCGSGNKFKKCCG